MFPLRLQRLLTPVMLVLLVAAGCTARHVRTTSSEPFEATPERLARGSYLVNQVTACGACHTTRDSGKITDAQSTEQYLGGGNLIEDRTFNAKVWVPNLTSDRDTGLGDWSDDEIARAIRDGIDRDGRYLSPWMPFNGYRHLSDEDVRAIVVYLRSVPPVVQERPRVQSEFPFLLRLLLATGIGRREPVRGVPQPDADDSIELGRYLVHVGHCAECHSLGKNGYRGEGHAMFLAGSEIGYVFEGEGKIWARNLTPDAETGIGAYSSEEIKEALRTGRLLNGKQMAAPMAIFNVHYTGMTDEDLDAIVAFLKSLDPVSNEVPARQLTPEAKERLEGTP